MSFIYGAEKKKFDEAWKKKAAWYRAEGMSDETIEALHDFGRREFCSERVYLTHTQAMPEEAIDEENATELFKRFESLKTYISDRCFTGKYDWIEHISDTILVKKLRRLSESDMEILTLVVIEGRTQSETAIIKGCSQSNIAQKIDKIKKYLK